MSFYKAVNPCFTIDLVVEPLYKRFLNDHNSNSVCPRGNILTISGRREDEFC